MKLTMQLEFAQQLSQLKTLSSVTIKGYMANEQIKQRQEKMRKFQEAEQNRLSAEIRNAEKRSELKEKSQQLKQENATPIQQKRRRIMRSKADEAFSFAVRLRANCTCERCGEQFPMNAMKHLHCSHNYSREYKQVRFNPDNAFALCKDCHYWFSRYKVEATAWKNNKLGKERLQRLQLALATKPAELTKAEEKRIAAYYRMVSRYLVRERENGNTDYIDFMGYKPFGTKDNKK